jgi:hypothetical protein
MSRGDFGDALRPLKINGNLHDAEQMQNRDLAVEAAS